MIGRAAMGNPWLFAALKREMGVPAHPAGAIFAGSSRFAGERRALILRHGEEMFLRHGEYGMLEMRKHLAWYSRGIPGAAAFRAELPKVTDPASFRAVVERFF
jgi:tRNA-dihydrouridine synthase B